MSYAWPTGWAPSTVTNPVAATVIPPQYIQDELARIGTPWDATKYDWDPLGMNLIDRSSGARYNYGNIANPALGTDVVTNLSNYNTYGRPADYTTPDGSGNFNFPEGVNPYIAFPGESYNAGLLPNSGYFVSADPSEIDAYKDAARTRSLQGVAQIGALVGGGALINSMLPAATSTGSGTATVSSSIASPGVAGGTTSADLGGLISAGMGPQATVAGSATGAGAAVMNNLPSIISGAASLLGGRMASNAAEDATEAQLQASREALDFQRESRDLALDIARPQLQSGNLALAQMLQMTGQPIPQALRDSLAEAGITEIPAFDVTKDPSYQFRLDEGMKALENSAFARGSGMSGGFAQRALRYAQDYASTEYSNIYGRLATVAGYGPVAANSSSNAALNYGANAANIRIGAGDARASGYVAQSNAWQNALDQIAKLPWDQWFKRQQPATAGA